MLAMQYNAGKKKTKHLQRRPQCQSLKFQDLVESDSLEDDPLPSVHVLVAVTVLIPQLVVLGLGLALPELHEGVTFVLQVGRGPT